MKKRLGILIAIILVVIGGSIYFHAAEHKTVPPAKAEDHTIASSETENDALYKALQQVRFIQQGQSDAKHSFYAVIDPNCSFCHALFEASQTAIKTGKLAVRWVVLGVVKPSSPLKAMAILNAQDPLKALVDNENAFNYDTEEDGIQPLSRITDAELNKLNQNIDALKNFIDAVPVIIYKNKQGEIRISGGDKLPLAASKKALEANQAKVNNFLAHGVDRAF